VPATAGKLFFVAPTFEFVNNNGEGWQYWIQDQQSGTPELLSTPSQNAEDYFLNMYYERLATGTSGATMSGATIQ
jgi:hypothetical protein